MMDKIKLGQLVEEGYNKECAFHLEKMLSAIESSKELTDTTVVGLVNAMSDILMSRADIGKVDNKDIDMKNTILKIIEEQDDVLRSFVLINKLTSEMLLKSMIAREVVKKQLGGNTQC